MPAHWSDDASATDQIVWFVLMVGGGLLLLAGIRISKRSPWPAAALISVVPSSAHSRSSRTVVALLVAITLVVLSVLYARRATGAAPATG